MNLGCVLSGTASKTWKCANDSVLLPLRAMDPNQEAVEQMLAHNASFEEQVQIGIDQIARGEFIEEDEMDARVAWMLES